MKSSPPRAIAAAARSRSTLRTGGRRYLQYFLLFVTAALVVNALIGDRGLTEMVRVRRERSALSSSLNGLRAENAVLRDEIARLKGDPKAIEDAARRDLGLVRPGEWLFIVKDVPRPAGQH